MYVGSDSTSCLFTTDTDNNHKYTVDLTSTNCGVSSSSDGTHTTYTATVNYDVSGQSYTMASGTVTCKG